MSSTASAKTGAVKSSARATVSGPARGSSAGRLSADAAVAKLEGTNALVAMMPFNPNKESEHGKAAYEPPSGAVAVPDSPAVTASTLTEKTASGKVGTGKP